MILFSKTLTKGASYPSYTTSSRSSIQMLPIISGLVEKQNPEIGNKKNKLKYVSALLNACIGSYNIIG